MEDGSYRKLAVQVSSDWPDFVAPGGLPSVLVLGDAGEDIPALIRAFPLMEGLSKHTSAAEDKMVVIYLEPAPSSAPPPTKAQLTPEDLDRVGPDWDVGYNRPDSLTPLTADPSDRIDYQLPWVALQRVEQLLEPVYDVRSAFDPETYPPVDEVLDPTRVYLVGHGTGGVHVYCLISVEPPPPWKVKAAAVINGTVGGYMHSEDRVAAIANREVKWVPQPGAPAVSLLHIRGTDDDIMAHESDSPVAPDGDISKGSKALFEMMSGYMPQEVLDLSRWDFWMSIGLDAWYSQLFPFGTTSWSGQRALGVNDITGTPAKFVAFDVAGNSITGPVPGLPGARLIGVEIDGAGHEWPEVESHGIGYAQIWQFFKDVS